MVHTVYMYFHTTKQIVISRANMHSSAYKSCNFAAFVHPDTGATSALERASEPRESALWQRKGLAHTWSQDRTLVEPSFLFRAVTRLLFCHTKNYYTEVM
jgi:hypothetical protein